MRNEAGTSLVEMAAVMALLAIVLVVVFPTLDQFNNTESRNESRQATIDLATSAVSRITKALRAASVNVAANNATEITVANPDSITFYSNVNVVTNPVCPLLVTISLTTSGASSGQLTETDTDPATSTPCYWPNSTTSTSVLATGISPGDGSSAALFQYFSAASQSMPLTGPVVGGSVIAVRVELSAQTPKAEATPTQFSSWVRLATPADVWLG